MGPETYLRFVVSAQVYLKVQGLTLLYGIGVFSRMRAEKGIKG